VDARHRYNETVLPPTCTQHPWTAPDGAIFSYSHWPAEGETRAVMVAVHGLSGAALDYEPLGRRIAPLGFATYAPELRGQGNDPLPARRGDLDRIETWFADLTAFIAFVRAENPGLPICYYGESMGAAILTRFLAQAAPGQQPAALILASPVIAVQEPIPAWINVLFRALLLVRPTYRLNVRKMAKREKVPRHVTRDEAHREWFATAPHKLDAFTIRFFKCLHDLISGCFDAAPRIHVPVLVIYAQHDIFIRTELVEQFFARLGSADKELTLYLESYHLLLHDHDREQVLERITGWLRRKFSARTAGVARNS
jgi:alpha-beta hydrolase superfamily lysophospholipase